MAASGIRRSARCAASGCSGPIELVRDAETREPLVPFNASGADAAPMAAVAAACKQAGLWPFMHFNRLHVAPPLVITEDELVRGLDIIDEALDVADGYVAVVAPTRDRTSAEARRLGDRPDARASSRSTMGGIRGTSVSRRLPDPLGKRSWMPDSPPIAS